MFCEEDGSRISQRDILKYSLHPILKKLELQQGGRNIFRRLRGAGAPDLRVVLKEGRLYLTLGTGKNMPKAYGGVDLKKLGRDKRKKSAGDLQRALVLPRPSEQKTGHRVNGELGESSVARVEMSITRIARTGVS